MSEAEEEAESGIKDEAIELLRRECRDRNVSYEDAFSYAVRQGMSRKDAAEAVRKAYRVALSGVQIVQGGLVRQR